MLNKFCSILNFQFLPVQNPPGGLEYWNLEAESKIFFKIGKLHPKRKLFCQITYPLTPKTKPIITVYAKVSELPPPPLNRNFEDKSWIVWIIQLLVHHSCPNWFPWNLNVTYKYYNDTEQKMDHGKKTKLPVSSYFFTAAFEVLF